MEKRETRDVRWHTHLCTRISRLTRSAESASHSAHTRRCTSPIIQHGLDTIMIISLHYCTNSWPLMFCRWWDCSSARIGCKQRESNLASCVPTLCTEHVLHSLVTRPVYFLLRLARRSRPGKQRSDWGQFAFRLKPIGSDPITSNETWVWDWFNSMQYDNLCSTTISIMRMSTVVSLERNVVYPNENYIECLLRPRGIPGGHTWPCMLRP